MIRSILYEETEIRMFQLEIRCDMLVHSMQLRDWPEPAGYSSRVFRGISTYSVIVCKEENRVRVKLYSYIV